MGDAITRQTDDQEMAYVATVVEEYDMPLDVGIKPYVEALRAGGVETFESCQGGEGHPFAEPTVRFFGSVSAGYAAYAVAMQRGLPVAALKLVYPVDEHKLLTGPWWEMTFIACADAIQLVLKPRSGDHG